MKSELIFKIDTDNCVHVDARKCGMEFNSVVVILGYNNENPLVFAPHPVGAIGMQRVLDFIKERPSMQPGEILTREYQD